MYDELIKRLRDCTAEQNGEKTLWCQAADAIEELQKAVNFHKFNSEFWEDKYNSLADEKWIPVTERLPEFNENVLVYSAHSGLMCIDANIQFDRNATHWMPLPESPKEET